MQLFSAIFIKYCTKCKSVIKKIPQNYFSLLLFSLIAWKRAIWRISSVSMLSMSKQLVCKLEVLQPQPSTTVPELTRGGSAENLGVWQKFAQTKIGCVKSFAVKCAHKCNFLRINATFVENKCNFFTATKTCPNYDVTTHCCETLAQTLAMWWASENFIMLRSYMVRNNSA